MKRGRSGPARPFALAASLLPLFASSTYAADLTSNEDDGYRDAPAIVSFPNWAGFYAGGHIGGAWGNGGHDVSAKGGNGGGGGGGGGDNNWTTSSSHKGLIDGKPGEDGNDGGAGGLGGNRNANGDPFFDGSSPGNPERRIGGNGGAGGLGGLLTDTIGDSNNVIGGLHLGYNWQRENFVFGAEGDISMDGGLDSYLASLRARFGLASNDMLFYITGGLALRDSNSKDAIGLASNGGSGGRGGNNDDGVDDGTSEKNDPVNIGGEGGAGGNGGTGKVAGFSSKGGNDTGFVVGAGFERMLSSNVSVGFEGLWYSFGDSDDVTVLRGRVSLFLDREASPSMKDGYLSSAVADWSGFYAGANVGVGFGDARPSVKTASGSSGQNGTKGPQGNAWDGHSSSPPPSDGIDDPGGGGGGGGGGSAAIVKLDNNSGVLAGIHLGYNWQDESRVFGIEGDADWADSSFRDYLASVRLRLGHAFDNILVYGTAGVAFAGSSGITSVSLSDGGDGGNGGVGQYEDSAYTDGSGNQGGSAGAGGTGGTATVTHSGSEDKIGFVVGAGFEAKVWDHTSFGIEGLYYGFDGNDAKSTPTSYTSSDDLSTAVVRARMTFHLNGGSEPLK